MHSNLTTSLPWRLPMTWNAVFNQVSYGTKSLGNFGPKIWNSLLHHVKSAENLEVFKKIINSWNGVSCDFVVCSLENIA